MVLLPVLEMFSGNIAVFDNLIQVSDYRLFITVFNAVF